MPASNQRRVPMKPISRCAFRRLRPQAAELAIAQIDPVDFTFLAFRVKGVVIVRIENDIKAVAAGERGPIGITNYFLARHGARPDPVLVVLKSAGDAEVRFRVVESDSIKFSSRNGIEMIPALAGRETLVNAAVGSEQYALANQRFRRFVLVFRFWRFRRRHGAWLNSKCVTIRMYFLGKIFPEIFPTVIGNEQRELEQINSLIVGWVDPDLAEIKRARIDRAGACPFLSAVFRAKNAAAFTAQIGQLTRTAFITLHHSHDDLRIARADRESDATGLWWQSSSEFLPSRAAIRAF